MTSYCKHKFVDVMRVAVEPKTVSIIKRTQFRSFKQMKIATQQHCEICGQIRYIKE